MAFRLCANSRGGEIAFRPVTMGQKSVQNRNLLHARARVAMCTRRWGDLKKIMHTDDDARVNSLCPHRVQTKVKGCQYGGGSRVLGKVCFNDFQ
jgi:hypothetical protein